MVLILIAGYPYAGKSSLAQRLGKYKEMSSVIRAEDKLAEGERIRKEFPRGVLARMVYDPSITIYSGVRSPEEVEVFTTYDEVFLVFVNAPFSVRLARMAKPDAAALRERDRREEALGLPEVRDRANLFVLNDGDIARLDEVAQWILRQQQISKSQSD